jgi:ribosomal-protein-alanine acetyltransferase
MRLQAKGKEMKQRFKQWWFKLRGKDPEAVIISFRSGGKALADAMCDEIRRLEPSRRHFEANPGETLSILRMRYRRYRIGLAPVLFDGNPQYDGLRRAAFWLAPTKILAYNARLERHHLKLTQPVASWLFLRGIPLDRIFLRPWWLCPFRKDKTVRPTGHQVFEGRARRPKRKSVAILTPYFPYPLSHGGAVRMFNLLKETAREFDVVIYAFTEGAVTPEDLAPVLEFATRIYLVAKPRYREPRWSSFNPPEAGEYWSPEMARLLSARDTDLLQTEYTYLARYGGDILVEHDVTYDLYTQVMAREDSVSSWWNWWRWLRFERRAISQFRRVVVMSEKDRQMLGAPHARVIENGVDTYRYAPRPEVPGRRLLFIGSFRHFPNIVAYRFLTEKILPLVRDFHLTVVAGPEPWLHWQNYTGTLRPPDNPRIRILEFVADVRPLYYEANVVVAPTLESAGTNIKVLEAMAMARAVVATPSGCAGLGLEHGSTVWIAESPPDFADGIEKLLHNDVLRGRIAQAAREHVERNFDWRVIARKQRALFRELLGDGIEVRPAASQDIGQIAAIQAASPEASQWDPPAYLEHKTLVAAHGTKVLGFIVSRQTAPGEFEILNLAVEPSERRRGIAGRLLDEALQSAEGEWFLEVRESNLAAIRLYEAAGFKQKGLRAAYYNNPPEAAIVMSFFSCYLHMRKREISGLR